MARKYFSVPFLTFRGKSAAPPPVSASNQARVYFDEVAGELLMSKNGNSWEPIGGQGEPGTPGEAGPATLLTVNEDGYLVAGDIDTINFTGSVDVSADGYGIATVNITATSSNALEITKNLVLNENALYTGYSLLGGGNIDANDWDVITFNTSGYVSRSGIGLEIILVNADTSTTIATQTFSGLTASIETDTIVLSGITNLEVWGRLTGVIIDGDIGVAIYSELQLQRI